VVYQLMMCSIVIVGIVTISCGLLVFSQSRVKASVSLTNVVSLAEQAFDLVSETASCLLLGSTTLTLLDETFTDLLRLTQRTGTRHLLLH